MSDIYELSDENTEWVEISPQLMQFYRSPPRNPHPGVQMHRTADLSMLSAALEEQLKISGQPSIFQNPDPKDGQTFDLCVSQFGEWPSRPDVSDTRSLRLSSGPLSASPRSDNASPPNSIEGSAKEDVEEKNKPWRLRHSFIFRWRAIGWLIDNFPTLLRHFASFLLGSATMFLMLKKRVQLPLPPP